ncbi:IclR family transcriptional regulator [Lutimaribacter sp. EGI FJ00015]|uniref:IclR family transcriptional regulator n=1 Tax=Lutimaribacter degradans TaxID=2945989 RepID=A0ACC5ZXV2_9RHOB|nr:IclR family transcriptional regulator [Lutimaribacter sp. EGI FJ00013]MCM2563132.1 IclR family transcriptional regulator [Lutimaribacter sp. EGI FJ00013]MCO0614311.1 IclR family transcriptional regulator [Lutimaribacter sp. EGI FJ00015]MCO0637121.1 IclR family transcriptional regulator [Lutimaribacter sp. EGI FJ00014]
MGTTAKALSLLNYFTRSRPLVGLSDMARLSGLNKATVYRLMGELAEAGFVEQVGTGREYRLGPAVMRLAALREHAVPMRDVAAEVLRDLSDATQETAHFSLMQGRTLSTVTYAYSPVHGTRVTMEDADVLMLHATSSGLAVLAYSAPDLVGAVLEGPLEARTDQTITDPAHIRRMLDEIRRDGVAESVSGFENDVHSHAAPIFDAESRAMGAIAVAAPTARMDAALAARIRVAVKAQALRLTRMLGGLPPPDYPRNTPDTVAGHAPAPA